MKNKQNNFQFNITNYNFIITPQRLIFNHRANGKYLFELEKGCQRIRTLSENAYFNNSKEFVFRKNQQISIKAYKQKSMNYSWTLYRDDQENLQFVQELKFDLSVRYNSYNEELKSFQYQYGRLLQKRSSNEPILENWMAIKSKLKSNRIQQALKDSTDSIFFEYILEIKNNFDDLAQHQLEKKRLLKKSSMESEGNSSSHNSLRDKSKGLSQKKKIIKSKASLERDLTEQKSTSSISLDNERNPQDLKPKQVFPFASSQQQGIMCFPQLQLKNISALSDILEASNEQSILNIGTDRKSTSISEPPNRSVKKTKTFHFGHSQQEKAEYKRNNSLQSIKYAFKLDDSGDSNIQERAAEEEDAKCDNDQFTNQSTIIKMESPSQKITEDKLTFKYFMTVVLIFVFFGCMTSAFTPKLHKRLKIEHQFLKNNRIKKASFN